jgi:ketosteroid isomerase-like protein
MTDVEAQLVDVSHAWDRAMVENDAARIGQFVADDWTIIGSDGRVGDKASFLKLVESGDLTHDVMESHDINVRVYGDVAVVLARGISGGNFRGQPFHVVERVSCVFVRQDGLWKCVSTHLSQLAEP